MNGDDIKRYRRRINRIDNRLMKLLAKRCVTVSLIGKIKNEKDHPVIDRDREGIILERIDCMGEDESIKGHIKSIYRAIFSESYKIQEREQS